MESDVAGLSIVKEDAQVKVAVEKVKADLKVTHFVVQQFVEGEPVSVSLLCKGKKVWR